MPKGTYAVTLRHKGYASRGLRRYRNRGRTLEIYHATLAKAGSISGTVKGIDGKPLAGLKIEAKDTVGIDGRGYATYRYPTEVTDVTDKNGRFEIGGLPKAGYVHRLHVSKEGYHQISGGECEVPAGDIQITMDYAGVIRGRVKGLERRSPGQEIHVNLQPEGGRQIGKYGGITTCKADGTFKFRNVPSGRYVIRPTGSPAREEENRNQPRKTIDFKPAKPGEILEIDLEFK